MTTHCSKQFEDMSITMRKTQIKKGIKATVGKDSPGPHASARRTAEQRPGGPSGYADALPAPRRWLVGECEPESRKKKILLDRMPAPAGWLGSGQEVLMVARTLCQHPEGGWQANANRIVG